MCARVRAPVRGRAPAFPCAPAPASCPPRCDASRIPNARSHPPGCSHSRARVHPSAAPPALHAPLALLGRSQRAGCPGPPGVPRARPAALAERTCDPFRAGLVSGPLGLPEGTPRASLLCHHAPPGRDHAPSLNPSQGAQLELPALAPKGAGSLLARSTARSRVLSRSVLSPLLSLPLLYLLSFLLIYTHAPPPDSVPLSLPVSLPLRCRRPLPRPLLPVALCCLSHSPHYIGCRPRLARPSVGARSGRRGYPLCPGPAVPSALHSLCGSSLRPDGRRRPALASVVADSSHPARA